MAEEQQYDIFISYRTTHSNWVKTLAQNLKDQGYCIFLDQWELIPGQRFLPQLHNGLKKSRCGLLIATPDAAESGWVQQELDVMQIQANSQRDFFFIPVIMGVFPDYPFIETIQAVDFGDSQAETYRKAFQRLLCGLKQQPPGADPLYTGVLQLPDPYVTAEQTLVKTEQSFVDNLFSALNHGVPLIILAQTDTPTQAYHHALCEQAKALYGADNLLHIYPPNSRRADKAAYFGRLAKQCQFDQSIAESWEWADALRDKLEQEQAVFLLVTGFENGDEAPREELAGEIRQLNETFPTFHPVIMGGEKLAALKYAQGHLSLLNSAEEFMIPSLSQGDLQLIFKHRYPQLNLQPEQLQALMTFTGCQPRLLHYCLQQQANSVETAKQCLLNSPLPAQLFTQFNDPADASRLCGYLYQQCIGQYEPWPYDPLIRRLYWNNLITREGQQFVWRCDFIREIGREFLGC